MSLKLGTANNQPLTSLQDRARNKAYSYTADGYFDVKDNFMFTKHPTIENKGVLSSGIGLIGNTVVENVDTDEIEFTENGTYQVCIEVNLKNNPATVSLKSIKSGTKLIQDNLLDIDGVYQGLIAIVTVSSNKIANVQNTLEEVRSSQSEAIEIYKGDITSLSDLLIPGDYHIAYGVVDGPLSIFTKPEMMVTVRASKKDNNNRRRVYQDVVVYQKKTLDPNTGLAKYNDIKCSRVLAYVTTESKSFRNITKSLEDRSGWSVDRIQLEALVNKKVHFELFWENDLSFDITLKSNGSSKYVYPYAMYTQAPQSGYLSGNWDRLSSIDDLNNGNFYHHEDDTFIRIGAYTYNKTELNSTRTLHGHFENNMYHGTFGEYGLFSKPSSGRKMMNGTASCYLAVRDWIDITAASGEQLDITLSNIKSVKDIYLK